MIIVNGWNHLASWSASDYNLEKIKHNFAVNSVIFLLMMNVKKLQHLRELERAEDGHVYKTFELRKVEFLNFFSWLLKKFIRKYYTFLWGPLPICCFVLHNFY